MKLDERMFFLWTKEDLADTKKLGTSCEDMEAYHERLRVRIVIILQLLLIFMSAGVEVSDRGIRLPLSDRHKHQHICRPGA